MLAGFRDFVMVYSDFLKFSLPKQSQNFSIHIPTSSPSEFNRAIHINRESRIWDWVQKAPGACAGGSVAFGLPTAALGWPRNISPEMLYGAGASWSPADGMIGKGLQAKPKAAAQGLAPALRFVSMISEAKLGTVPRRIPCCLEGSETQNCPSGGEVGPWTMGVAVPCAMGKHGKTAWGCY